MVDIRLKEGVGSEKASWGLVRGKIEEVVGGCVGDGGGRGGRAWVGEGGGIVVWVYEGGVGVGGE